MKEKMSDDRLTFSIIPAGPAGVVEVQNAVG